MKREWLGKLGALTGTAVAVLTLVGRQDQQAAQQNFANLIQDDPPPGTDLILRQGTEIILVNKKTGTFTRLNHEGEDFTHPRRGTRPTRVIQVLTEDPNRFHIGGTSTWRDEILADQEEMIDIDPYDNSFDDTVFVRWDEKSSNLVVELPNSSIIYSAHPAETTDK